MAIMSISVNFFQSRTAIDNTDDALRFSIRILRQKLTRRITSFEDVVTPRSNGCDKGAADHTHRS
jgi:hypothetical protein